MLTGVNCEDFVNGFIEGYIELGFGILSKRDLEVLLFHLLYKNGFFGSRPSFFDISKMLKISETRVRNLYQDVQLRYDLYSEEEAITRLIKIIEDQRFEVENVNGRIKYFFQIREPLLRQYFEEWVDDVKGISDTSFSPTITVISREVFLNVLNNLTPDTKNLINNIQSYNDDPDTKNIDLDVELDLDDYDLKDEQEKQEVKKSLLNQFLEKYVDTIAEESAKSTLTLAATGLRVLLGLAIQQFTGLPVA